MQIDLSDNTLSMAKSQAAAAGFLDVKDYIASLIAHQKTGNVDSQATRTEALEQLRQFRQEVPHLSSDEIVEIVRESRAELP